MQQRWRAAGTPGLPPLFTHPSQTGPHMCGKRRRHPPEHVLAPGMVHVHPAFPHTHRVPPLYSTTTQFAFIVVTPHYTCPLLSDERRQHPLDMHWPRHDAHSPLFSSAQHSPNSQCGKAALTWPTLVYECRPSCTCAGFRHDACTPSSSFPEHSSGPNLSDLPGPHLCDEHRRHPLDVRWLGLLGHDACAPQIGPAQQLCSNIYSGKGPLTWPTHPTLV